MRSRRSEGIQPRCPRTPTQVAGDRGATIVPPLPMARFGKEPGAGRRDPER